MAGNSGLSRRSFLALSAAAVAGTGRARRLFEQRRWRRGGGGGGGSTEPLKFWNMPWGQIKFNPLDQKITEAYKPEGGMPPATYQVIQWANFTQTFASAVASRTNPAVSSGGGTQAFQFEDQGALSYADEMYETWKSNGLYDDFLPGLIDTLKVEKGYAAIPYNLDMRVIWMNKSLLDEAGAEVPDRLAVLPERGRRPEEEQHLRLRHRIGRRRLHRSARDRLLDDQQRRWALRREQAAELRHPGEHRGRELRPRDGVQGLRRPGQFHLHLAERAEPVEGEEVRPGLRHRRSARQHRWRGGQGV